MKYAIDRFRSSNHRYINFLTLLLLLFILFICLARTTVSASDTVVSGSCGTNLVWVLDNDGRLTISGTGEMNDYSSSGSSKAPWYNYRTSIKKVIIGDSVTNIGRNAFFSCNNLVDVSIGDNVKDIGNSAFSCCSSLTDIVVPNCVTSIGASAFYCCFNLSEMIFVHSTTFF